MRLSSSQIRFVRKWRRTLVVVVSVAALLTALLPHHESLAQTSITSIGTAFSENFDGIGTTATAALPANWRVDSVSASPTTNYASAATATTQAAGTSGTGILSGTSSGGTYNFANGVTATSTDRAVGWLTSGSYSSPRQLFVQLTNNTGLTLNSLQVNFDIEKYRSGTRAFNINFFSGTDGSTWTARTDGDQAYAADANNTTVFNPPTTISKSVLISGLSIANGSNFYLRWSYTGVGGSTNGQALGIDNFQVTANVTASSLLFRSAGSGNWNSNSTWEMSTDNTTWVAANQTPTSANGAITIRSGHTVTVTAAVNADELTVDAGATLTVNSGVTLTIDDGSGTDLNVNGTTNVTNDGIIGGAGSFSLNAAANLGIGAASGITSAGATGNIQVTGTRTFSTAANYTYNRTTSGQVTGNGLPATVNNLTVTTVGVLSLGSAIVINGDFLLNSAVANQTEFSAGTQSVTINGNYTNNIGVYSASHPGVIIFGGATSSFGGTGANNNFGSVTIGPGATLSGASLIRCSGDWQDNSTVGGASGHLRSGSTQFTAGGATRTVGGTVATPKFASFQVLTTGGGVTQAAKGLDIDGTMSLSSGEFNDGGFSHTVHRDWFKSGGTTYTATGTITFDGQFSSAIQASNFNNVGVNKDTATQTATLSGAITIAGTLTLTKGRLVTSTTNLPSITNTAANAVSGGSSDSFVQGPLARMLPASLVSGSTYVFPTGKGSFNPFELVNPTTNAGGSITVRAEVFDANSGGTAGSGLTSLATNRYWEASITANPGNFTNTSVRVTDATVNSLSRIGKASTVGGTYDSIGGTVVGMTVLSNTFTSFSFFNLGGAADMYRSAASGSWNAPGTWEISTDNVSWAAAIGTPTSASDFITVRNGHTVTVTANVNADQLTVASGGTLNINSGVTLTIDNGSGTDMAVDGTANVATTGVVAGAGLFALNNGTVGIGDANGITTDVCGTGATCGSIRTTTRTFSATGNYNYNGTVAQATGNGLTNAALVQISNTTGAVSLTNGVNVTNDFQVLSGATLNTGVNIISGSGMFTLNAGGTLGIGDSSGITSAGASGNIQVTGTRTFSTAANYTYNRTTSGQVTGNGLPATVNNLTVTTVGVLSLGSAIVINGDFLLNSAVANQTEFSAGTQSVTINGNYTNNIGVYSASHPGVIIFGGATSSFGGTGANNNFGSVTIGPGATLSGASLIRCSGDWQDNSTVGGASGHLRSGSTQFTAGGATRTVGGTVATPKFASFQVLTTGGGVTQAAKGLDIDGTMSLSSGEFNDGGFSHTVHRDWFKSGGTTYTATGTITFDDQFGSIIQASNFNNFRVSKNAQATTVTLSGNISVAGSLEVITGTLLMGTNVISGTGTFMSGNGTTLGIGSVDGISSSGATGNVQVTGTRTFGTGSNYTYNGAASQNSGNGLPSTVNNLTFSTVGTATLNAGLGATTINGILLISSGATLDANSKDISVAGTAWTNNGAFTPGTQTVSFTGAVPQTIGGTTSTGFNSLTINNGAGGSTTMTTSGSVNGTLTLNTDLTVDLANDRILTTTGSTSAGSGDVIGTVRRDDVGTTTRSFGNSNVQITNGNAMDLQVTLLKSTPGNFSTAVTRIYTLNTISGAVNNATLRLRYLDPGELNGNDESMLTLWRATGSPEQTWQNQGFTTRDATNNWVELTGISGFSSWVLASGAPAAPTAVTLTKFEAISYDDGVALSWSSGYEVDNLGYQLQREVHGRRSRVTPSVVAGSALRVGAGRRMTAGYSYAWFDAHGSSNTGYYLEALDLDGTRQMFGPIYPAAAKGKSPISTRALLLNEVNSAARSNGASLLTSSWTERSRDVVQQAASISSPEAITKQHAIAAGAAAKIVVTRPGWYRLTRAQLSQSGINLEGDARYLQMFVGGEEIPIRLSGNGIALGPTDTIEFYGAPLDTPTTGEQIYWLISGTTHGKRIGMKPSRVKPGDLNWIHTAGAASFQQTTEVREEMSYLPFLLNGDAENIFGPLVSTDPVSQSINVRDLNPAAGPVTLEVALQGASVHHHTCAVRLNGTLVGTIAFSGTQNLVTSFSVSPALLREGENSLTFTATADVLDLLFVDWVRLSYPRRYQALNNRLQFTVENNHPVHVDRFTSPNIRLLDITNPEVVNEIAVTATETSAGYGIAIPPAGFGPRTMLAFADDQFEQPAAIVANVRSAWHSATNAADLVIITHSAFKQTVEPLAAQRRDEGLAVAVVEIDDVYDEFGFGAHSPEALKAFFAWAAERWQRAPSYVLLAGDSTFDPRNYLGQGANDFVPTKLIDTAFLETSSDDWFVDLNNDSYAEMAIGRLPARTQSEAALMVAKILAFELNRVQGGPLREGVMIADNGFESQSNETGSRLPPEMQIQTINRSAIGDDSAARSQIVNALNAGPLVVNFYGHGSVGVWTGAGLLDTTLAENLTNANELSLFVMMTCLNGYAHDAYVDSLAESVFKAPHGGAVAVWASSGFTDPQPQFALDNEFFTQLFGTSTRRLGEAARKAKFVVGDPDVRRTWILLGDPTMRVRP